MRRGILILVVVMLAESAGARPASSDAAALVTAQEAIRRTVVERLGGAVAVSVRVLDEFTAEPLFRDARPDPSARLGSPVRFTLVPANGAVVQVSASLDVTAPHVLVTQAINRGHAVDASTIETRDGALTGIPLVAIAPPEDVVGSRALRPLTPGEVVLASFIALKRVIEPGDRVIVVAIAGAVEVTATYEAADGGRIGDTIRVRNPQTRKYIRGRIVKAGLVEVIHDR